MEIIVPGALGIVILLLVVLLLRSRKSNADSIPHELSAAQQSIDAAKDTISDNALKIVDRLGEMNKTMQELMQQQGGAQKLGESLRDLLQSPKLRGNYGEVVLEEMLEQVLPRGIWERNVTIEGRETVDFVVRFRETLVPIDAKFPREDYLRYLAAETDDLKMVQWKAFEVAVKKQVSSIRGKYIKPEHGTTDFALMFIPSEAIYYETIAEKNYLGAPSSISGFAQENHVFPTSPNTFYAFLQIIILSIRNSEIVKNARQLQTQLTGLQRDFDYFYSQYQDIGKELDKASAAFRVGSGHVDRYKRRLDDTLKLEALQEPPADAIEGVGEASPSKLL